MLKYNCLARQYVFYVNIITNSLHFLFVLQNYIAYSFLYVKLYFHYHNSSFCHINTLYTYLYCFSDSSEFFSTWCCEDSLDWVDIVSSSGEIESCFDSILEFYKECKFWESRDLSAIGFSYFVCHISTDIETIHCSFDIFSASFPFATGTCYSL